MILLTVFVAHVSLASSQCLPAPFQSSNACDAPKNEVKSAIRSKWEAPSWDSGPVGVSFERVLVHPNETNWKNIELRHTAARKEPYTHVWAKLIVPSKHTDQLKPSKTEAHGGPGTTRLSSVKVKRVPECVQDVVLAPNLEFSGPRWHPDSKISDQSHKSDWNVARMPGKINFCGRNCPKWRQKCFWSNFTVALS